MKNPVLVIMAAGMGSRYGGLKQIDPIDQYGNKIIDFSVYDAKEAGFEKVIFIIKRENLNDFKQYVGERLRKYIEVEYVFQEIDQIPEEYEVPKERVKPWGTAHAVLSCKRFVEGSFAVINADDYYGKEAFQIMYNSLLSQRDNEKYQYVMVGYKLINTLTENGYVSRGICTTDSADDLLDIVERTHIENSNGLPVYIENGNQYSLSVDTIVSMNMWGFTNSILKELEIFFEKFMEYDVVKDPLKAECYLPAVVNQLLKQNKANVKVLKSDAKWYGVTYKEDKPQVMEAIQILKNDGLYPQKLWE